MNQIRGLKQFCDKHQIPIPTGDDFNLLEWLLAANRHQPFLAEYKGRISEIKERLGSESEEWGGCPQCGTDVHVGLDSCPVCGLDLTSDMSPVDDDEEIEGEIEDDDQEYEDEVEEYEEEDPEDTEEEAELEDDEEYEEEYEDGDDGEEDDDYGFAEDIDEDDEGEEELGDDDEDESEELDDAEEEEDDEELEDEEEVEPLAVARKDVAKRKLLKRKEKTAQKVRNDATYSEKQKVRDQIRKELKAQIPKMMKNVNSIDDLEYRKLLMMPGLLGYQGKPATIGNTVEIKAWVKRKLLKKRKANAAHK